MHVVREVTDQLTWIGANDHRLTLFENIHPIPEGVSYNSYVLTGEKTVLFDTVDWDACRQMLENLEYVLDGRDLDYIVVNHWEPDHAASLQEVITKYPNAQIIGNTKGFQLAEQFGFQIDEDKKIVVNEGDVIDVGDHKLTFFVHADGALA